MKNKTKIGLMALLAGLTAGEVMAGDLTSYATGDVLICFRNGGTYDLVVDAGPISNFTSLGANQRYNIGAYNGKQLSYVGTNGVSWSAFTWLANNTLYMTRARTALNTQTDPWQNQPNVEQNNVALRLAKIPVGAVDEAGLITDSTATAVIEEDNTAGNQNYQNGQSYNDVLSKFLNFNRTFQGNPENTTTNSNIPLNRFTMQGKVVRSDFYQLTPTSGYGLANFLGYFEMNTNGLMTYVAYPSTPAAFVSISRNGNVNTISYTTGLYGTYTLRGTDSAGLSTPQITWPAIGSPLSNGTAVYTTTDTTSNDNKFYTITAQ